MDTSNNALVLTGAVLPGHDAAAVWPAFASYFRMEPDKVTGQLVPRAPVTIKESTDLAKLQGLQDGLRGIGAESEIHPLDARGSLFAAVGGQPRGPLPFTYIESRVRAGDWPSTIEVAEVGSSLWKPFANVRQAAVEQRLEPGPFAAAPTSPPPAPMAARAAPYVARGGLERGQMLPAGEAIHAGFWRRCAAMFLDTLILIIPFSLLNVIPFLGFIAAFVGQWLYFALMEASPSQATIGKQVMGIKVTDDYGGQIDFGRATGRYFGKILSSLILSIGYFMAGFTERKQGLHDLLAGCCVVFSEVDPGRPMPTTRPPMPWYGWLLNILCIALPILGIIGLTIFLSQMNLNWH